MIREILKLLIHLLAPDHRKQWARAMQVELDHVDSRRAALGFALGCLLACARFRLEPIISRSGSRAIIPDDRFLVAASIAGVTACLVGLSYLYAAGAPVMLLLVNGGALIVGLCAAMILRFALPKTDRVLTIVALSAAAGLFATAGFGQAIAGARRWLLVGPFFVQTSLMLLPLLAICFARVQNRWTTLAALIAALAMAIQPDRAMAGMLFLAVVVLWWLRPGKMTASAAVFCTFAFAATLLLPDKLPAVPYVDHIIWSAFEVSLPVGLSIWIGSLLILCPIFLVPIAKRTAGQLVFTACWLALVASAAMGAYPTPLVGYGASAIIGYFLSVALAARQHQTVRSSQGREAVKTDKHDKLSKIGAFSSAIG